MKSTGQVLELDVQEMESLLEQVEQTLGEQAARPFRLLLAWHLSLVQLIERKNTTLDRLRRMLFGSRTERTRDIVPPQGAPEQTPSGQEPTEHG
jgi:transposase